MHPFILKVGEVGMIKLNVQQPELTEDWLQFYINNEKPSGVHLDNEGLLSNQNALFK